MIETIPDTASSLNAIRDHLYSNHEVAELLRKDKRTINAWARQKRFPKGTVLEIAGNRWYKLELLKRVLFSKYKRSEEFCLKDYDDAVRAAGEQLYTNNELGVLLNKDPRTIDSWARQDRFPRGSILAIGCNRLFRADLILRGFERNYNERRV